MPDIHGKPRQSEPAHFSVQDRLKAASDQQKPGFVHFCLDSHSHFSSVKLQGTNSPVCIQEDGSLY